MADFAFASCLPGVEPGLKREVTARRPELRFAFSRPGFVTFKSDRAVAADDPPGSAFARVWGRSLGAVADLDAARAILATVPDLAAGPIERVHVFSREPDGLIDDSVLRSWHDLAVPTSSAPTSSDAIPGELVLDVVIAPGERTLLGLHRHDDRRLAAPGGRLRVDVPSDAPSRAFAKIEEAIAWAHLPITAGHVALEIGAAPGGAALALARRGLDVLALDPGELAPVVLACPTVRHLPIKVGALRWEDLPPRVDWLLVDVNLAPQVALHEVARLMPRLRPTLRGAVITLKMNDWAFVDDLPKLAERVRAFGFPDVRLQHLPSNRHEICCVALSEIRTP